MITNLKAVSFESAASCHYSSKDWKTVVWGGKRLCSLVRTGKGTKFYDADAHQETCAIRLSIALYMAGATFTPVRASWWFDDINERPAVKGRAAWKDVLLPSLAKDYHDKVPGYIDFEGDVQDQREALEGRIGIIFFHTVGTASGHVTLWNRIETTNNGAGHDEFFGARKVRFWPMRV